MSKLLLCLMVTLSFFSVLMVNAKEKDEKVQAEDKKELIGKSKAFEKALKTSILIEANLKKSPDSIIFSVDGLCCNTCAIGIGKKVSKVKAVDVKQLPKGVSLDRKNGLLTVAIKKDEKADVALLATAIRNAGYEPTNVYKLAEDGKVNKTPIESQKNKQ